MLSKKKVYQAKPILDGDEAVRYLTELIGNSLTPKDFVALATAHQLPAFIEVGTFDYMAVEMETDKQFRPTGLYEVVHDLQPHMTGHTTSEYFSEPKRHCINISNIDYAPCPIFRGPNDKGETVDMGIIGEIDGEFDEDAYYGEPLLFKPADIQALADKLNGKPTFEGQQEELTALRERVEELEKENAELKAQPSTPKPLDPRTEATLLCIIGALADEAEMDLTKPMRTGDLIANLIPDITITGRTIGEHLKDVKGAMDSRRKKVQ